MFTSETLIIFPFFWGLMLYNFVINVMVQILFCSNNLHEGVVLIYLKLYPNPMDLYWSKNVNISVDLSFWSSPISSTQETSVQWMQCTDTIKQLYPVYSYKSVIVKVNKILNYNRNSLQLFCIKKWYQNIL